LDQVLSGILLAAVMFGLLGGGVWIALSLIGVGLVSMILYSTAPMGKVLATSVFGASGSWALTSLPLFIWMAEILFRTRLSEDMFNGLAPWVNRLPGRLVHVNILGCGIFAAVSGSSAATCATIGKMSVPELKRLGYDEGITIGTLAGSGTLGLLIPPSIIMIVYGFVAEVSIGRLFIAGVLPGIMMIVLFMGYTMIWAGMHPGRTPAANIDMSFLEKVANSRRLIPVILLIASVIASIYLGFATPTEAAAVGVLGALALSLLTGTLNWTSFSEALMGATRTSCMIALILAAAAFLAVAMGFAGIPRTIARVIGEFKLSPYELLAALTVLYIVLGCFLDGISMVVLTSAVVQPMIRQAGIDPLWFGIYIVLVVEMAQITPPVGFNLYVLQALTGRDIWYITRAAFPFFLLLNLGVVILVIFPDIALILPRSMMGG
jgi:C4-dicarboxylate transporter, DctM subunit